MSETIRLATFAMGTRFELVLSGGDPVRCQAAGEAALEEIEDWDRRLSRFRRDSFLNHIHRCAPFGPVMLDEDTFGLFAECERVRHASGGAFDITVGALMGASGFHQAAAGPRRPAGPAKCSSPGAVGAVGAGALELDPRHRTLRFARLGVSLDLGGVGKGHALDLAAKVLRDAGIEDALLHGGTSTSIGLGAPPGTDGWRVAIEGGDGAPTVRLRDAALSVSAGHGRTLRRETGELIAHVFDPRAHRAVATDTIAAVVGPSARTADAWSTALLVAPDAPMDDGLSGWVGTGAAGQRAWRSVGELDSSYTPSYRGEHATT